MVQRTAEKVTDKTSRAARPDKRVPVSGNRDITTVHGLEKGYKYRWVLDNEDTGQRIWKFRKAAWDFVKPSEKLSVGDDMVFKTADEGSVIRLPAGDGRYQYLMRIAQDLYNEDQVAKQSEIDATESHITQASANEGQYGEIKINK